MKTESDLAGKKQPILMNTYPLNKARLNFYK